MRRVQIISGLSFHSVALLWTVLWSNTKNTRENHKQTNRFAYFYCYGELIKKTEPKKNLQGLMLQKSTILVSIS